MERAIGANQTCIWGLEHPLVYTTGLKTEKSHILDTGLELVPARRGGSVTLHNPGQLVIYFAFPLAAIEGGLERFVRIGEATLAEIFYNYTVAVNLSPGASGLFTEKGKIAFIGLGLKKNFIYHGFSINISNDLSDFQRIQSCGLTLPMTRMADLLPPAPMAPTTQQFFEIFIERFSERMASITPQEFRTRHAERYDLADWRLGFKVGWLYFHERRYWEAHECWEMFWHEMAAGDERIFMHAMIQVAMAYYKIFTVPNKAGATSLLTKALEKFAVVTGVQLLEEQAAFLDYLTKSKAAVETQVEISAPPVFALRI